MEIALNKESKRKTPVAIAFRDGERTFGDDAITAGMRRVHWVLVIFVHVWPWFPPAMVEAAASAPLCFVSKQ